MQASKPGVMGGVLGWVRGSGIQSSLDEVKSNLRTDREDTQVSRRKGNQSGISGYRRLRLKSAKWQVMRPERRAGGRTP